jgi:hypothetical protein
MNACTGIVRWRIEKGLFVASQGREGDGYLEIEVARFDYHDWNKVRVHVEVEVSNFYPAIASRISQWAYANTQSRIHVLACHAFLRSLGPARPRPLAVGRFAGPWHADDTPDPSAPPRPSAAPCGWADRPGRRAPVPSYRRRDMRRAILRSVVAVAAVVLGVVVLFAAVPACRTSIRSTRRPKDRSAARGPALARAPHGVPRGLCEPRGHRRRGEDGILPSFLQGEKTLLVAAGNVDAAVDFRGLGPDALRVSEDRRSVTITLPPAKLTEAKVDLDRSRVFDRDRGLLDRVGSVFDDNPSNERELLLLAERKLEAAARADGGVLTAAERNTRAMLESLMGGLGFEQVTVRFEPRDPAAET